MGWSEEKIASVAAESDDVSRRRETLRSRVEMLKEGQEAFREAMQRR